jgi:TM2 domain-containing membrane protein YozV
MEQNAPPPIAAPAGTAFCRICGKQLPPDQQRLAYNTVYCAEHLPAVEPPPSPWTAPPTVNPSGSLPYANASISPGLAFILGLLPGVGAIYNAQYAKGLVHVLVFGMLISLANSDSAGDLQVMFGFLIPTWVIYQAFEAYHTARRRQMGEVVDEFSGLVNGKPGQAGPPIGPFILIGLGVLFLLHNFELLRLSQVLRFWPVALIAAGVYLLYVRMQAPVVPIQEEVRREQ